EALELRAVDQSGMQGRQSPIGAPDRCVAGFVALFEGLPQDAAPLQLGAENRTAEGIQNQELEPLANRGGNLLVSQLRHELGDSARVGVLSGRRLSHKRARGPTIFARRRAT